MIIMMAKTRVKMGTLTVMVVIMLKSVITIIIKSKSVYDDAK